MDGDGFSTCDGDCDDNDPYAYPGAAELSSETLCMRDEDNDGWGSVSVTGTVVEGTDCDDTDPFVYFGAAELGGINRLYARL